jgi:hypothetical protein
MDAYSKALRRVTLSGPTLFGPVINTAAQMAAESLSSYNSTKYYVLLIITVRMSSRLLGSPAAAWCSNCELMSVMFFFP